MLRYSYKFFALVFSCVVFFGLGACAIHPLPHDVTGYTTPTLVRKIRCEAREAVVNAAVGIVHRRHQEIVDESSLNDAVQRKVPFTTWEQENLAALSRIGIVYDFSLQGVETGGLSLSADIVKPLSNGTETYSPSLSDALKRDNTRAFTVSDSFKTLRDLNPEKHCKFRSSDLNSGPNYQYPIAGRIGIDEMIQTFVQLAVSGDLVDSQGTTNVTSNDILSPAGPPTMVDTLIFTTTLNAGLNAEVMLSPAGTALQLTNASLMGSVGRVDTHMVTIGLALGPGPAKVSANAVAAWLSPSTSALFLTQNIKEARSGEYLAGQAIAQQYIRRDLFRRGASIAIAGP
jgi:hypothetical protein